MHNTNKIYLIRWHLIRLKLCYIDIHQIRFNYITVNAITSNQIISNSIILNSTLWNKILILGGTINSETSLKDFFYPETGIYRFKPGEGLSRCTRYVVEDLTSAFPCSIGTPFILVLNWCVVVIAIVGWVRLTIIDFLTSWFYFTCYIWYMSIMW